MPDTLLNLEHDDDLRPVALLAQELTGRRPSPPTVWRWVRRGTLRAGRLPALQVFGTWHTTREALLEWLRRGSERSELPSGPASEQLERSPALKRRLRDAGLL